MTVLKYFTGLILLASVSNCFANNEVKNTWWSDLNIEPKQEKLNGLTPAYFSKSWVYATFVSFSDIKALVSESDYQQLLNSRYSFAKVIDLDGNGKDEAIRVGVYKTKDNKKGIFIAIFEEENLIKVITDNTAHDFSALLTKDGDIRWYHCMECDDFKP